MFLHHQCVGKSAWKDILAVAFLVVFLNLENQYLNYLLLRIELVQKEKIKQFFFGKREQNDFSQPDFGGNLANQLIIDADAWGGRFIFFKVSSNTNYIFWKIDNTLRILKMYNLWKLPIAEILFSTDSAILILLLFVFCKL